MSFIQNPLVIGQLPPAQIIAIAVSQHRRPVFGLLLDDLCL